MPKKKSYEEAIGELEQIVNALEGGELPLDEAIKSYEKGMALSKHLQGLLGDARRRVSVLLPDGGEAPFGAEIMDESGTDNENI
jgi:exodeoxyribonuclease VII small subunit